MAETFEAAKTLEALLTERGPLRKDELAELLRDADVPDPDTVLRGDQFELHCPVGELVDERFAWLPALLAGRVFTHRLGADELTHDLLLTTPDLDPITGLCMHPQYQRLADGSAVQLAVADYDDELLEERNIPFELIDSSPALLLAPGTLAALGVGVGDLIGVRLSADGLVVEPVAAPGDGAVAGARLAATLTADESDFFDAAAWTACSQDPALFTEPLPPLSEIADAGGLVRRDAWLAPAGFDFGREDVNRDCARLAERHDLDDDEAFMLYALLRLHENMERELAATDAEEPEPLAAPDEALAAADAGAADPEEAPDLLAELGAALADPRLADALAEETDGSGALGAAALGMFAEVLEAKVPPAARVACRWLRAVALERTGDVAAAERELLAAEAMDVDWPLPLLDLARFASDRGDAEHGLALLHRAEAPPDHPLVQLLQRYRIEPRGDLGRNEPCWCGSGRKYKKCHLGREELPLAERVAWLYTKAGHYMLLDAGWNESLMAVALERARYADPDESTADALAEAMTYPLVIDAVLFEGGAFAEFLATRGSLLPDDERALAEQWLQTDRSVFEIEQVNGASVRVRDVRTDDVHDVPQPDLGRRLKPGQLVCARVVPAGDAMAWLGGLEAVDPDDRDALIALLDSDPDAATLVAEMSG
ncbi:zinc-binding protein [Mycobacterium eburneum]|nr:zinc-binding protein [Mycobacterium eburneum]